MARSSHHSALTLVELVMGMVLTTLVMGALAAFVAAAGQSWMAADEPQNLHLKAMAVRTRIEGILHGIPAVGYMDAGSLTTPGTSAGVVLWMKDGMNLAGATSYIDGKVQRGELGLLKYDSATGTLEFSRSIDVVPASLMAVARANLSASQFHSTTALAAFNSLPPTLKTTTVLASNVSAVWFELRDTGDVNAGPSVDFVIRLRSDASASGQVQEVTCYGSALLDNPTTPQ